MTDDNDHAIAPESDSVAVEIGDRCLVLAAETAADVIDAVD